MRRRPQLRANNSSREMPWCQSIKISASDAGGSQSSTISYDSASGQISQSEIASYQWDAAGNIRLNTELVKKPRDLLEYAIMHEMAHLLEPTHNDRFVGILDLHSPGWRE